MMEKRLIITNGQSGIDAIRKAGIQGDLMSWDDVLHEGPVPFGLSLAEMSRVRADYLASRGWGDARQILKRFEMRDRQLVEAPTRYDEVVIFVEHDLYDQLQLLQVLAWFEENPAPNLTLTGVLPPAHIGYCSTDELRDAFDTRLTYPKESLVEAAKHWSFFTTPYPNHLLAAKEAKSEVLVHIGPAFKRLIEEYPDKRTGLSRIETQMLGLMNDGIMNPVALFRAYQKTEEAVFLGDWSFWMVLHELAQGKRPLIATLNNETYRVPPEVGDCSELMNCAFGLTASGKDVLAGHANQLALKNIDRWIGGVHLTKDNAWCWDSVNGQFSRFQNP